VKMEKRQIIVIADDFTGAAEIGGIGLRHGLKVAIEPEPILNNGADLMVIATDTRSMSPEEAAENIRSITSKIMGSNPFLVYKKVDSVLRGNVAAELEAQLDVMGLDRALVVAANPVFSRVIRNGRYFINEVPLHETSFSLDHLHPIMSNDVTEIVQAYGSRIVCSSKHTDPLPETGLIIGDVETNDDLHAWTTISGNRTLFAGASGFFNAILNNLDLPITQTIPNVSQFQERALFILGSAFPKDNALLEKMKQNGHFHSNMPASIFHSQETNEDEFQRWVEEVVSGIDRYKKAIVSSVHTNTNDTDIINRVKKNMARLVREVLSRTLVNEILIEGGSTTTEILNELRIKKLVPVQEISVGVIRMEIENSEGLYVTTKPGSYSWPPNVWKKDEIEKMNNSKQINLASYG